MKKSIVNKLARKQHTVAKVSSFIVTFILVFACSSIIYGQSKRPLFIGLQPAITVEPFYEEGEMDVNVFPLIVETPIGERLNVKLAPILNYHIGGVTDGISDVGLFTILPIYLKKNDFREEKPSGLYVGPVLGFGRNLINDHYTTTVAAEPGYFFKTKNKFSISMGLQLGGSYFSYDSEPNKWVFHWGPKITFGFWVN